MPSDMHLSYRPSLRTTAVSVLAPQAGRFGHLIWARPSRTCIYQQATVVTPLVFAGIGPRTGPFFVGAWLDGQRDNGKGQVTHNRP